MMEILLIIATTKKNEFIIMYVQYINIYLLHCSVSAFLSKQKPFSRQYFAEKIVSLKSFRFAIVNANYATFLLTSLMTNKFYIQKF